MADGGRDPLSSQCYLTPWIQRFVMYAPTVMHDRAEQKHALYQVRHLLGNRHCRGVEVTNRSTRAAAYPRFTSKRL